LSSGDRYEPEPVIEIYRGMPDLLALDPPV
jgi:hypothetical protein